MHKCPPSGNTLLLFANGPQNEVILYIDYFPILQRKGSIYMIFLYILLRWKFWKDSMGYHMSKSFHSREAPYEIPAPIIHEGHLSRLFLLPHTTFRYPCKYCTFLFMPAKLKITLLRCIYHGG
jgi:hypothetical protein